ncbi:MAG TPA: FHIPEP family type III secretion protein, partial [Phycisphaerales bacterium]|nr:FHIPEP family type III secretion protein [Phycisphaerales bacterium]
ALRRSICQQYVSPGTRGPRLLCVTLDPALEDLIGAYVDRSGSGTTVNMPAGVASQVAAQIVRGLEQVSAAGAPPVVLASPQVRAVVRQIVAPHLPAAAVLGYHEIVGGIEVESLALVGPPAPAAPAGDRAPQHAAPPAHAAA